MLGYVYWPDNLIDGVPSVPSSVKTAMMCSTLAGTMVGQVGFGFAADVLGRRKMYGLELVIIIVGTMLLLMSSNGEKNSMAIGGWLITWRTIMGMSEQAPPNTTTALTIAKASALELIIHSAPYVYLFRLELRGNWADLNYR